MPPTWISFASPVHFGHFMIRPSIARRALLVGADHDERAASLARRAIIVRLAALATTLAAPFLHAHEAGGAAPRRVLAVAALFHREEPQEEDAAADDHHEGYDAGERAALLL